MEILQHILAFIVAIGILITFHEFGHYWVARRFDVKILRFSVGFGRTLWRRKFGPDQTEFVIAALPLGGYVKMLDEREGEVLLADRPRAFNNKPVAQRFAIVAAGPLFNFIFAVFAYCVMYMIGMTGLKPLVDEVAPASVAASAGFQSGDEILAVDDRNTPTWAAVAETLIGSVVASGQVEINVQTVAGDRQIRRLDLSAVSIDDIAAGALLEEIGLTPVRPPLPAVIGQVVADSPAAQAGIQPGDRIVAVDGQRVADWFAVVDRIRALPEQPVVLEIERGDRSLQIGLTPALVTTDSGEKVGQIGAGVDTLPALPAELRGVERYAPWQAAWLGVKRTAEMSVLTLRMMGKILTGQASVKNLSGPISIAQFAGFSAAVGLAAFLGFLAIVSVSLGVINLLPVPLLDGGHLMYYLIEIIKGSPVSESTQMLGQHVGLVLLLSLMTLVIYNDVVRLLG
ncbi:MAG: RIP metalloprotease RseP [Gammaproteobacteria bacterium]